MKTCLLTNGDSWTFGSEIMAPEFCVGPGEKGEGMAGRFKPGRACHHHYNDYYRVPRTWPSYLGKQLGIENIVNISHPARSNDTIYETTIEWLLRNYIYPEKNTNELLVVIGWSSPERKNIIISNSGDKTDSTTHLTIWPAQIETKFYSTQVMKDYFKFYVMHQWAEQEFIKRYIEQNFQLQNFCKAHNIDYYVFNAFYAVPNKGPESWHDININDEIDKWDNLTNGWADSFYSWDSIIRSLKMQWYLIDDYRFINKDHPGGSFRSYIYHNVPESIRMCNWHPSPESHEAWAKFLANHIR